MTAYTDAAFVGLGTPGMPSDSKMDYTQGADGLWRYNGGAAAKPTGPSASQAAAGAAGAEANRLIQAGESAVTAATTAAGQNLSAVQSLLGGATAQSNADLNTARGGQAALTQTADKLGGSATDVKKTADQVGAQSDIFKQYADSLNRDATFARANALPWLEQGESMLAMDPNATGMAGEWGKLYKQMSPDSLAAGAATDTRKAASVAEGDMLRSMARRGISAGSGAVAAALGKLKEREESSVAAMMTSAKKLGLSLQSEALKSGFAMALQASGMGKAFSDEALNATTAAASAQNMATSALNAKGSLQTQAANIVATQGNLYGAAGNLALGIAGNVTQRAASGAAALTSATNTQVNAQQVAADYYSTQGGSLLSMLTQQKYNVLTALFGGK